MVTEATSCCWTLTALCLEIPPGHKKQEDAEATAVQRLGEGAGAEEEGEQALFLFFCLFFSLFFGAVTY